MSVFSIITINYNNGDGLRKTISSVLNQTFSNYEYIIIDGGSTDGSAEEIKLVADKLTYWVSEPDKGVYHAMNKGIAKANGEYCILMNSGDCFNDNDVLSRIFNGKISDADIIYGNTLVQIYEYEYLDKAQIVTKKNTMPFCHQSAFTRRVLHLEKPFDTSYKICADKDFFANYYFNGTKTYLVVDTTVSRIEGEGLSSRNIYNQVKESAAIEYKYNSINLFEYSIKIFVALIKTTIFKIIPRKVLYTFKFGRHKN